MLVSFGAPHARCCLLWQQLPGSLLSTCFSVNLFCDCQRCPLGSPAVPCFSSATLPQCDVSLWSLVDAVNLPKVPSTGQIYWLHDLTPRFWSRLVPRLHLGSKHWFIPDFIPDKLHFNKNTKWDAQAATKPDSTQIGFVETRRRDTFSQPHAKHDEKPK